MHSFLYRYHHQVLKASAEELLACFTGNITKVVDGDTIDVNGIRIRLSLVNTPEIGKEHFTESKRFAEKLCPVGTLALVDQDDGQKQGSFGRMIGEVYCNYDDTNHNLTKNLNQEMIKSGYANILTKHCIESEFANETWATTYGSRGYPNGQILFSLTCLPEGHNIGTLFGL